MYEDRVPLDNSWPFAFRLEQDNIWDGFIIISLIEDAQRRNAQLVVPHTGLQHDRFVQAMQQRNMRIQLYSQPELLHCCRKCMRTYPTTPGGTGMAVFIS